MGVTVFKVRSCNSVSSAIVKVVVVALVLEAKVLVVVLMVGEGAVVNKKKPNHLLLTPP